MNVARDLDTARCPARGRAAQLRSLASLSGSLPGDLAQLAHQAVDHLGRKPARREKARLRRALGCVARQAREAPRAHRGSTLELRSGKRLGRRNGQGHAVLRQLAADSQIAEAAFTGVNA